MSNFDLINNVSSELMNLILVGRDEFAQGLLVYIH